jgi:hypothetical protein
VYTSVFVTLTAFIDNVLFYLKMNNELRVLILFSVIVKIYNFVVNMLKSGAERTRAWRERKRTSEVTVQNVKKTV